MSSTMVSENRGAGSALTIFPVSKLTGNHLSDETGDVCWGFGATYLYSFFVLYFTLDRDDVFSAVELRISPIIHGCEGQLQGESPRFGKIELT